MDYKTLVRGTFACFNNWQPPKKVCSWDMQEILNSSGKIELKLSSKNTCVVNNLVIKVLNFQGEKSQYKKCT